MKATASRSLSSISLVILVVVSVVVLTFCDLSGPSVEPTPDEVTVDQIHRYGGSQSPGDYWEWVIDRGSMTFSAKNFGQTLGSAVVNVYSGTIEVLPSKFLKFVITATDDAAAEDGVSYGIEIPGTAILVQPAGVNQAVVAATNIGGNPQVGTYNWVAFPSSVFTGVNAYGSSEITDVDAVNSTFEQEITFFSWDGTASSPPVPGGVFADGMAYVPDMDEPVAIAVFTPLGCFSSDSGPDGGNFGVVKPGSPVDLSLLTNREYRGFVSVFGSGGTVTMPTWMDPDDTVTMAGGGYAGSTPEGAIDSGTATEVDFSSVAQTIDGLLVGVTTSVGTYHQDLVIAVGIVQGKYVLFGIGQDSDEVWLSFLLMEQ